MKKSKKQILDEYIEKRVLKFLKESDIKNLHNGYTITVWDKNNNWVGYWKGPETWMHKIEDAIDKENPVNFGDKNDATQSLKNAELFAKKQKWDVIFKIEEKQELYKH